MFCKLKYKYNLNTKKINIDKSFYNEIVNICDTSITQIYKINVFLTNNINDIRYFNNNIISILYDVSQKYGIKKIQFSRVTSPVTINKIINLLENNNTLDSITFRDGNVLIYNHFINFNELVNKGVINIKLSRIGNITYEIDIVPNLFNCNLRSLSLTYMDIHISHLTELFKILSNNDKMEILDLYKSRVECYTTENNPLLSNALLDMLTKNKKLHKLYLPYIDNFRITSYIDVLSLGLLINTRIDNLHLDLTRENGDFIIKLIDDNTNIRKLSINYNRFLFDNDRLFNSIIKTNNLVCFSLSGSLLDPLNGDISLLSKNKNPSLKIIACYFCTKLNRDEIDYIFLRDDLYISSITQSTGYIPNKKVKLFDNCMKMLKINLALILFNRDDSCYKYIIDYISNYRHISHYGRKFSYPLYSVVETLRIFSKDTLNNSNICSKLGIPIEIEQLIIKTLLIEYKIDLYNSIFSNTH